MVSLVSQTDFLFCHSWSSPVLTRTHSDIAFYGVNLNQSIVLSKIGFGKADTPWGTLWNTAVGNIIVSSAVSVTPFPALSFSKHSSDMLRV